MAASHPPPQFFRAAKRHFCFQARVDLEHTWLRFREKLSRKDRRSRLVPKSWEVLKQLGAGAGCSGQAAVRPSPLADTLPVTFPTRKERPAVEETN